MRNTSFNMVVSLPDGETKHYSLNTDKVRIGRGEGNQITVPVGCVSSRHCEILRGKNGNFSLVDLGSKNGTEINGVKAVRDEQISLNDGDYILFGQTVYGQIIEVSNVTADADDRDDADVGKALAQLTKQSQIRSSNLEEESGETTQKIMKADPADLDDDYEELTINPVAAAVAKATRAFSSE